LNSPSYLIGLALLYVCALFAVAWFVDRRSEAGAVSRSPRWRGAIYALSIAVFCSSWTFYGAVGSATASPWSHAPIYVGPILVFLFAWPLLRRLQHLGSRHRVTSVADYFGARFGKRQSLSTLVTVVALAAVLPYIALQFRALAHAWEIIATVDVTTQAATPDAGLAMAIILAAFAILFGARRLDGRERHQGMMTAIALESLVKLLAFVCVAALAVAYLRRPDIAPAVDWSSQSVARVDLSADFLTRTLISACAVLCLPRQFHVMVVEAQGGADTRLARWLFPAYLLLFMLLVVPVSLAGAHLFGGAGSAMLYPAPSPDTYVQWVPRLLEAHWVSLAAFIGGISAATGMVIVATVSLAIMLTNEVAVPLLVRRSADNGIALLGMGKRLRSLRQLSMVLILAAAWAVSRQLAAIPWLTEIGFMSFLAAAQLAPGLLVGLYWRGAHGLAVLAGLAAGLLLWFYCLVLPAVLSPDQSLIAAGPLGVALLRPQALLGWHGPGPLTYAATWSLGANLLLLLSLSCLLRPSAADRRQAAVFMDPATPHAGDEGADFDLSPLRAGQLRALLPPFVDASRLRLLWRSFEERYQQRILPADRMPLFAVRACEAELAGVIGTASANRVIDELTHSRQLDFGELATLVSDASRQQTFNRELLETTIESMLQGVSVVDADLRLVAWNSRYEEMFDYPERLLYVGLPIERLYRFNAERGFIGGSGIDIDAEVSKRLDWLRRGSPHRFERHLPDGRVIDIHGNPMPNGGFVTTYIDISDYREVVTQLEETRTELESRVASGSRSLSEANAELRREVRLRAEAETRLREANQSKSRFMSATSHDLLQPINAARLFAAALRPRLVDDDEATANLGNIDDALGRAEGLIAELREIARLDSGAQDPEVNVFPVAELLRELYAEFEPLARRRGLRLRLRSASLWLHSDRRLVYRILQNLLGNAIKYAKHGSVLLGVRRRDGAVEIQVLDQGPGIAESERARAFTEFERLSSAANSEGLGLGLAIVARYASLLALPLRLDSVPGRGSLFSIIVPRGVRPAAGHAAGAPAPHMQRRLAGVRVLCIDNDASVRAAMLALLTEEGAEARAVAERRALRDEILHFGPAVIVADYHLDEGDTGIAALRWACSDLPVPPPAVIVSADDGPGVRDAARAAGHRVLPKPVNPTRLIALLLALADGAQPLSAPAEVSPGPAVASP
jgi:Na+/proline symporter/signal transduction histidine kinase/CheY-like chemotaxis protein